ncbi:MAG: hypothetical protein M3R38_15825 [Actinomycetota bacterium]|nr:hypothetical protein [Actinomycetota bacterium]
MRRATLLLAMVAAALLVGGGAAWAITKDCPTIEPCYGTSDDDVMHGNGKANHLYGLGGEDRLYAYAGIGDTLNGGKGDDQLHGARGWDIYVFNDGWGEDSVFDPDVEISSLLNFRSVSTPVSIDLVPKSSTLVRAWSGTNRVFTPTNSRIDDAIGGRANDVIVGHDLQNLLSGQQGNDRIYGRAGRDQLVGGEGEDKLYGGSGGDDFLQGDSGDDVFFAKDGEVDSIFCGEGVDTVHKDPQDMEYDDCEKVR